MIEHLHKGDVVLGAGAVTSPIWLQFLDNLSHIYIITGGVILITGRVAIMLRDWFRR